MTTLRIPGLAWPFIAALLLMLQTTLANLIFGANPAWSPQRGILLLYYLLSALAVWACAVYLSPLLERRYPGRLLPRLVFGLLAVLSCLTFITIAVYLHLFPVLMGRTVMTNGLLWAAYRTMMVSLIVYGWLLVRSYTLSQGARTRALQQETDALATDVDRSELAMLEAQIEPHFLFNTLAHVKRLYRVEPAAASAVLATLIDYLQRALPALRRTDWCVADEFELIELYLSLIEQRFAGRLRYRISAAPDVRSFQIPALTIATLVENAVRHGLAPKADCGTVVINAWLAGQTVLIEVTDNGVGLRQSSGSGLGLATVRARLRGKFGAAAMLVVGPGEGCGVRAFLRIEDGGVHGRV